MLETLDSCYLSLRLLIFTKLLDGHLVPVEFGFILYKDITVWVYP